MGLGLSQAMDLNKLRLDQLQEAIRSNEVSFPAQVPLFIKHSERKRQCHVVLLYFVRGWSCERIAKRYTVTRQHIWQMVSEWRRNAVALGYLQVIPPLEVLMPAHRAPARTQFRPWADIVALPAHAATHTTGVQAALR